VVVTLLEVWDGASIILSSVAAPARGAGRRTVPIDPGALSLSISRLEDLDPVNAGLDATLNEAVEVVDDLFDVDGAGILLLAPDDVLRYAASSDEPGRMLELLQEQTGEGPCIDAFMLTGLVRCNDIANDPRYPAFGPLAVRHGLGAVLGVPIELKGGPIGTLNTYCSLPHDWDESEAAAIQTFTRVVGMLLRTAAAAHLAGERAEQLQYALDNRVIIEQAKGVLMERGSLDPSAAFELLRSAARTNRVKVGEVARRVVAGEPLGVAPR
jgi:GAF domain-containing protein